MNIPEEVKKIMTLLSGSGFEAYAVGGCVRDSIMGKDPDDWDLATNASPEKIQSLFEEKGFKVFYENDFGTVGIVLLENKKRKFSNIVEITTYRTETDYSNNRHPDSVQWATTIEEDLSRRDFTVNSIAVGKEGDIIDPYNGRSDITKKIIKAVGDPEERFNEDILRIFRAVRFASTLDFSIEEKTLFSIKKNAPKIDDISKERIRVELVKILMSRRAMNGIDLLREVGILKYIIPEIIEGYGVAQNKHHIYDCYWHNLYALDYAAKKDFNFYVRLSALLHDVAKPAVKVGEGDSATFYNHEVVGEKMTIKIMYRLKFSKKDIEKVSRLVRYHLFYYNVDEVTESSVRRLVRQVGEDNIDDLIKLRMCDRIGSGVPKAEPYKLRHLQYLIDKISQDPLSVKMLAIKGDDIMRILELKSGPKIGWILSIIFNIVLSDPTKNSKDFLEEKVIELGGLTDKDLKIKFQKANNEINHIALKNDQMMKKRYWVK